MTPLSLRYASTRGYLRLAALLLAAFLFTARTAVAQVNVLTYHNDSARTGQNLGETALTPANVNFNSFGWLFSVPVDGYVYTQPLYVFGVTVPGLGTHNVVYAATEHNSVYAFDADGAGAPLWSVNLGPSVPSGDVGVDDITPEIGITGTPVIDAGTGTLYVVAKTKEINGTAAHYIQRLHALDITTGAEKFGGPAVIADTILNPNGSFTYVSGPRVSGNGGASVGGTITFNSFLANQRPALLLANGVVYVSWASHGDNGVYHGWVVGYNAQTLAQAAVFCDTPNLAGIGQGEGRGGIWMGGGGPAADSTGNLFLLIGNGAFSPIIGDYGDSAVRLNAGLSVTDYFTPYNQNSLNSADIDLGSGAEMLLPDSVGSAAHPHLMVGCGKQGVLYLIDRDTMGEYNSSSDAVVQEIGLGGGSYGTPAYFNNSLYYANQNDVMRQFTFSGGTLSSASITAKSLGSHGATPSISANGSGSGIVWILQTGAFAIQGPETLQAYSAANLQQLLYTTATASGRDNPGAAVKFAVPTVTNGKVYVGAESQISVFGLFTAPPAAPSPVTALAGNAQTFLSWPVCQGAVTYNVFRSVTAGGEGATPFKKGLPTASFNDIGLTNGKTYFYTVTGVNNFGQSLPSTEVNITPSVAAGQNVHINCGGTMVAPYLADMDVSGGGAQYMDPQAVDTSAVTNPAPQAAYQTSRNGNCTYTIPNLTPGASYAVRLHFAEYIVTKAGQRVFGVTINGQSVLTNFDIFAAAGGQNKAIAESFTAPADSNGKLAITLTAKVNQPLINALDVVPGAPPPPPAAPASLTPTPGNGQVALAWAASAGASSYTVSYGTASGTYTVTLPGLTSTGTTVTGLTNGTPYFFAVQAVNAGGTSPYSPEATATPPPPAPTGLTATPGNGQVTLTWSAVSGAATYNVYQSTTSGGEGTAPYKTGLPSPTFTDTGLTNGTAYFYTVTAVNAAGESPQSSEVSATPQLPPPPAAPASLTPTPGNGQVALAWAASAGATSYTLSYGTASGAYTVTVPGLTGLNTTVTGLTNGTPYFFAVQAVNAGGTSPYSPEASATPTAAAAAPGIAIDCGGGAAGTFVADTGFTGGTRSGGTHSAISTAGVTNPAPQAVYQTARYGSPAMSYVVPSLTPGAAYTVRLHFAEFGVNRPGMRVFGVSINGQPVLTNFDIFAAAGGQNRAVVESFPATADVSGKITIAFTNVTNYALINGIEVTH